MTDYIIVTTLLGSVTHVALKPLRETDTMLVDDKDGLRFRKCSVEHDEDCIAQSFGDLWRTHKLSVYPTSSVGACKLLAEYNQRLFIKSVRHDYLELFNNSITFDQAVKLNIFLEELKK